MRVEIIVFKPACFCSGLVLRLRFVNVFFGVNMFSIHDVHFYNPQPKTINRISVHPSQNKLALSRSDNTIEIWDIVHTPHIDRILISENSVESIIWCGDDRLLSSGVNGIVEYDLLNLTIKFETAVTSGPCWCIDVNRSGSMLAAGTEDGYINLFAVHEESLMYEKLLDKQEGRILCIAWNYEGDFIVSGSIDAIRIWNVKTGHAVHKLSPGRTNEKETIIWAVAVTDDFTIISGDSNGKLVFWDGNAGMYMDSFQSHKTDILTICLDERNQNVYCAGVDPLIASYSKVPIRNATSSDMDQYKWVKCVQRNLHDHDVRALAMCKEKLFSAGVDGYLALSSYPPKILIKYSPLIQRRQIQFAEHADLLLFVYDNFLEVWQLSTNGPTVKMIDLKSYKNRIIRCSGISSNGRWIFYSTDSDARLFHFSVINPDNPKLKRIDVDLPKKQCAVCCSFSADSKHLVIANKRRELFVYKLNGNQTAQRLYTLNCEPNEVALDDVIHLLSVQNKCEYIIAADRSSSIAVWKKSEYYCSMPKYKSTPTAMAVDQKDKNVLICYADHKIVEYSLIHKKYTSFSRKLDSRHPKQWLNRQFPVEGILIDPRDNNVIILYDDTTICVLDKTKKLPESKCKIPRLDPVRTTPESSDTSESSNSQFTSTNSSDFAFHVLKMYKHLVFLGALNQNDLMAVEVSPEMLIEKLPPVFYKRRYGVM